MVQVKHISRTGSCILLLFVTAIYGYQEKEETFNGAPTLVLGNMQITLSQKLLVDIQSLAGQQFSLHGYLGWVPRDSNLTYTSCGGNDLPSEAVCFQYGDKMKLTIQSDDDRCDGANCESIWCQKIVWENHITGTMDCFHLGENSWYGGGERLNQHWPLQNDSRTWHAFVTGDPAHHPTGDVLENLWLTSSGFLIFVDRDVPLYLSFNESNNAKLCFSTASKKYPFGNQNKFLEKKLSYTICSASNVKEAQEYAINKWLGKPEDVPDERMFLNPVWSTWARYKAAIDENKVMDFVQEIIDHDFPNSHVEIDDMWQSCYGDLEFDLKKFPDPKRMIQNLNNKGFRTTLWVHPFCNINCKRFKEGTDKGYFIKDSDGKPAIVEWWDGTAAVLDTTNEDAVEWFVKRLELLRTKYGIDAFKFDAGEIAWLPAGFQLHDKAAKTEPNLFTQRYVEMAAKLGGMVEVRSAWNAQGSPVFVRIYDKDSRWDYDNGLKTLIPTSLHFSHMGYPFVLPDMVGGNNYGAINGSLPEKELYIRWLQANAFLPSIQFSILPWEYDDEVIQIASKMVKLHQTFGPYIMNIARNSVSSGTPMIRPLWWHSPNDPKTWEEDSEFLLGDKVLVAPVLEKNKRERDIYLPEGRWLDGLEGSIVDGPLLLRNYKVDLEDLPYFLLQSREFQS